MNFFDMPCGIVMGSGMKDDAASKPFLADNADDDNCWLRLRMADIDNEAVDDDIGTGIGVDDVLG